MSRQPLSMSVTLPTLRSTLRTSLYSVKHASLHEHGRTFEMNSETVPSRARPPDLVTLGGSKKTPQDSKLLIAKARAAYAQQATVSNRIGTDPHAAGMAPAAGPACQPATMEALAQGVREAPRFGLNAKALILQAAAAAGREQPQQQGSSRGECSYRCSLRSRGYPDANQVPVPVVLWLRLIGCS